MVRTTFRRYFIPGAIRSGNTTSCGQVATRVRPDRDIFFIPGAKGAILDPTSDPQNFTVTKMGTDATRPAGRDFAERLAILDDQRAKARALLAAAGGAEAGAGLKE
jgi:3-polyprenyl-4-hydroxybenzoate decarboxylase